MEYSIKKKTRAKFVRKCPFVRLVKNFGQNAMSTADSIFSGPRKEGKILSKKKYKNFCLKVPLVPTGQGFRLECYFVVFAPKPANSIFSGPKRNWKILLNEEKIGANFV